jgi:hypothetical protein
MIKNDLYKFLYKDGNSHARENIINHHVFYEISLAGAQRGYELQLFTQKTDHEGVDLIVSDNNLFQKIQLKTVMKDASTSSWDIHARLLRPEMINATKLGFHKNFGGIGFEGCAMLIEVEVTNTGLKFDYLYTDIFVLNAFAMKFISRMRGMSTSKTALKILKKLGENNKKGKVKIPRGMFIKLKNTHCLLSLFGMTNSLDTNFPHKYHIKEHGQKFWSAGGSGVSELIIKSIANYFEQVTEDTLTFHR